MGVFGQPVDLNGKLYVVGVIIDNLTQIILEYTPETDHWARLPPLPVSDFTVATLRGQLLIVGGTNLSTNKITNSILTFDAHHERWVQSYPAMPTTLTYPTVISYQNYLIVAAGLKGTTEILDVNILNTSSNQWITAEPLPSVNSICTVVLIQDDVYLVGQPNTQTVLRAHVPTLISGAKSGVWKTLANTSYIFSSAVAIDDMLVTLGGSEGNHPTTSIQMYNPTTNKWTKVGDLPEPMIFLNSVVSSGKLFVLGYYIIVRHVYVTPV